MPERAAIEAAGLAAVRTFWRIASRWKLNDQQQMVILGVRDSDVLHTWQAGDVKQVPEDTLTRLSFVLGIYKAINILLPDPERADAWFWKPNHAPFLNGQCAMQRMLSGDVGDLQTMRQYLDSELTY